jgi:hypothetical protein
LSFVGNASLNAEFAEPVKVLDGPGRQRQSVAGRELGDAFAVTLAFADLGAQAAVDLFDRCGELLLVGR